MHLFQHKYRNNPHGRGQTSLFSVLEKALMEQFCGGRQVNTGPQVLVWYWSYERYIIYIRMYHGKGVDHVRVVADVDCQ